MAALPPPYIDEWADEQAADTLIEAIRLVRQGYVQREAIIKKAASKAVLMKAAMDERQRSKRELGQQLCAEVRQKSMEGLRSRMHERSNAINFRRDEKIYSDSIAWHPPKLTETPSTSVDVVNDANPWAALSIRKYSRAVTVHWDLPHPAIAEPDVPQSAVCDQETPQAITGSSSLQPVVGDQETPQAITRPSSLQSAVCDQETPQAITRPSSLQSAVCDQETPQAITGSSSLQSAVCDQETPQAITGSSSLQSAVCDQETLQAITGSSSLQPVVGDQNVLGAVPKVSRIPVVHLGRRARRNLLKIAMDRGAQVVTPVKKPQQNNSADVVLRCDVIVIAVRNYKTSVCNLEESQPITEPVASQLEESQPITAPVSPQQEDPQTISEPVAPQQEDLQMISKPVAPHQEDPQTISEPVAPHQDDPQMISKPVVPHQEDPQTISEPVAPHQDDPQMISEPVAPHKEDPQTISEPVAPHQDDPQMISEPVAPRQEDPQTISKPVALKLEEPQLIAEPVAEPHPIAEPESQQLEEPHPIAHLPLSEVSIGALERINTVGQALDHGAGCPLPARAQLPNKRKKPYESMFAAVPPSEDHSGNTPWVVQGGAVLEEGTMEILPPCVLPVLERTLPPPTMTDNSHPGFMPMPVFPVLAIGNVPRSPTPEESDDSPDESNIVKPEWDEEYQAKCQAMLIDLQEMIEGDDFIASLYEHDYVEEETRIPNMHRSLAPFTPLYTADDRAVYFGAGPSSEPDAGHYEEPLAGPSFGPDYAGLSIGPADYGPSFGADYGPSFDPDYGSISTDSGPSFDPESGPNGMPIPGPIPGPRNVMVIQPWYPPAPLDQPVGEPNLLTRIMAAMTLADRTGQEFVPPPTKDDKPG